MPIYEYECKKCGNRFEELVSPSTSDDVNCPVCGSDDVAKLFSPFSSGSGSCNTSFGGT